MERRKKIGGKGGVVQAVNDGGDEKFLKQGITEGEERGKKLRKKRGKKNKEKERGMIWIITMSILHVHCNM